MEMTMGPLKRFEKKLHNFKANVDSGMVELNTYTAEDALLTVRRHSSGRPGPNVVTGAYLNSWRAVVDTPRSFRLENDSPQKFRLEYGFYGTDSMGRMYSQPAFPHIRPAMMEVRERYRINVKDLVRSSWRSA